MILQETYTLADGVEIPKIGLGTWFIDDGDAARAVRDAVEAGYRHIDSAQAYGNERGVGEGVRSCGVSRDEVFVTTKLAADIKSHDAAVIAIDGSLEALGLDRIDLVLIHSPQPWDSFGSEDRCFDGNREAWRALEEAVAAGKVRTIGVSNFQEPDLDNILDACEVAPTVNQVLAHVTNVPTELIEGSRRRGMLVEAYSPMGHGELFKDKDVAAVAERYGVSIAQLAIRYTLQLGLLPLPKTADPDHMRSNAAVDFAISDEDMRALSGLDEIADYGEAGVFPVYARS
ncbi:MAG: aldo/keto reductase [Actinobacteria bacterium]|nr:aldo/keto reductase [Actinomycetota bacterium]